MAFKRVAFGFLWGPHTAWQTLTQTRRDKTFSLMTRLWN